MLQTKTNKVEVTRYKKTNHSQIFAKSAFLVSMDSRFTVEFNGQVIVLKLGSYAELQP